MTQSCISISAMLAHLPIKLDIYMCFCLLVSSQCMCTNNALENYARKTNNIKPTLT